MAGPAGRRGRTPRRGDGPAPSAPPAWPPRARLVWAFWVDGRPRPQGSGRLLWPRGAARPVLVMTTPTLRRWRAALAGAALATGARPLVGEVGLRVAFFGRGRQPDLDKLTRAVLDALTGVCYGDDAQVTALLAQKVWRAEVAREGAQVEVWAVGQGAQRGAVWAVPAARRATMASRETSRCRRREIVPLRAVQPHRWPRPRAGSDADVGARPPHTVLVPGRSRPEEP